MQEEAKESDRDRERDEVKNLYEIMTLSWD